MSVDKTFDIDYARTWAEHDPDADTARQVLTWIEEDNSEELAAAFAGPLNFGTAGLRAAVGAGESRMNRAVVIRTTYGLITWLKQQVDTPVVVIGCDARYKSADFARDTAAVVTAAGGVAIQLPEQLPTPLTAFALTHLRADAAVMVTASHNPPADNGYKVYLGQRPLLAIEPDAATARAGRARTCEEPRSVGPGLLLPVRDTGIEPVTSSVSGKRATAAPIARVPPGGGTERTTGLEPATLTLAR